MSHCCNHNDPFNCCLGWLCAEDGTTCDVGYIYNLEEVAYTGPPPDPTKYTAGASIIFLGNAITRGGISHDNSIIIDPTIPANINISNTGLYEVIYYLATVDSSRTYAGLQIDNGTTTIIPGETVYGSLPSDRLIYGHAFIQITVPNSILRVTAVTDLQITSIGPSNVTAINASVIIKKICEN